MTSNDLEYVVWIHEVKIIACFLVDKTSKDTFRILKTNEEFGSVYNIDFVGKISPLIHNCLRQNQPWY
jgi:hypothetical protein